MTPYAPFSISVHNNIGLCLMEKDYFKEALNHFQTSLSLKKNLENDLGIARTLGNIAHCYLKLNMIEHSIDWFEKALALKIQTYGKSAKNEDIAMSLQNLGKVYFEAGQTLKAKKCFKKGLKMFQYSQAATEGTYMYVRTVIHVIVNFFETI